MELPYDIYRKLNPQYFSDTVVVYRAKLTKEVFRNEMDKLSNDTKEYQFENFVTILAHRFITPNVVPQTGPTGGGDGKTDIETHPVADKIAEKWYVIEGGCKGGEKWAFAISCKKDWKGKVKKDVDKIVKLRRGFTKIYFCSNRQIRSADRKKVEADLKNEYGVDIIILDQEWFVLRVFDDNCIDIAVKELGLSQEYCTIREIGPEDLKRQRRLAEIDEKIANNTSEDCFDTEYVDLVLESAFLSRALEVPPSEMLGKFICAERISKQYGTKQQQFNAIWQRAWTEFYWLRNPDGAYQCYLRLKDMIDEEVNVNRLESILSLYAALKSASFFSLFETDSININSEDAFFENLYRVLEHNKVHQSSFLFLKLYHLEKDIMQKLNDKDALRDLLPQFADTIKSITSSVDISFEAHCYVIKMISQIVPENEMLDDIVDYLTEIMLSREQEITAAEMQMERGSQLLQGGYFSKAIKHLGQCVSFLGKEPTKAEYIIACCTLGDAYMGLDLLYSSKVMLTKAVAMILYNIETAQSPNRLLIVILSKLCYLSLRSGQIVNFLMAFESMEIFVKYSPSYQDQQYYKEKGRDERRLAARFLSGNVDEESYSKLPAIMQRLGMTVPVDILFYKLGYPDCYSSAFKKHMQDCPDWEDKMRNFIKDPLFLYANSIPDRLTRLETLIHGCRFIATFDSDRILQIYSELFLALMESLISTLNQDDFVIRSTQIYYMVVKTNNGKTGICKGASADEYVFIVNSVTINGDELWSAFITYLPLFFAQNTQSRGVGQLLADKQKKEKVLNRLSAMMNYEEDVKAIYGDDYKNTIDMWTKPDDVFYPFNGKEEQSSPFEENRGVQA